MIIKWETPEHVWHWIDCVEEVTNYAWHSPASATDIATRVDGDDASVQFKFDGSSEVFEGGPLDRNSFTYLLVSINGDRQHILIDAVNAFVLSDEGKTVDRLV